MLINDTILRLKRILGGFGLNETDGLNVSVISGDNGPEINQMHLRTKKKKKKKKKKTDLEPLFGATPLFCFASKSLLVHLSVLVQCAVLHCESALFFADSVLSCQYACVMKFQYSSGKRSLAFI